MKCDKCKKLTAEIEYKGGNYCTWYCIKKKKVELPEEFFHDINGRLKELIRITIQLLSLTKQLTPIGSRQ